MTNHGGRFGDLPSQPHNELATLAFPIELVPATSDALRALRDDSRAFAELLGGPAPAGWPEFPEAIEYSLARLNTEPPADAAWGMAFFVERSSGAVVGSGGFHAPPSDDGAVEIGYEIAPDYRGRGLGIAAAAALLVFAERDERVHSAAAHTLAVENSSTGVLRRLGFEQVEEARDPDVGPVWGWRRPLRSM